MNLLGAGDRISQVFDMTIIDKIAEGGMGEVYEAILHGVSGFEKRIALKLVRSEFAAGGRDSSTEITTARRQEFLLRLVNEAKLCSNLIHTHIVQIYLLGTIENADGSVNGYIAMEYVNGVSVRSFIDAHLFEEKLVPIDMAVYVVSRVARALEYAHRATDKAGTALGIVHRDVSPTNVLISLEGVVKLSDFGIAKAVSFDPRSHEYIVGKKRYMAPEQAESGDVDFRADVYAAGLLLYELLCNRLPEDRKTVGSLRDVRPEVPEAVDAIVRRAIQWRAQDRFASTEEFAVALERAIYEKGYGPTFVSLAEYIRKIFPSFGAAVVHGRSEERTAIHRPT